jgi:hypothetical protein
MKKLLIVAGAGASLEFGMPSVNQIDILFTEWSLELFPLGNDRTQSLYTWVKDQMKDYSSQNKKNRIGAIMNFESILYTIQNLSGLHRDKDWKNFNNRTMPFVTLKDLPNIIKYDREESIATGDDFSRLHSHLIDNLLNHFRVKCRTIRNDKAKELDELGSFFNKLKTKFELGILNLNYDNIIHTVLPDLDFGYNKITGEFSKELLYKKKWDFCFHLHGSVHFDMTGSKTELHKIQWNNDLSSTFASNSSGRSGIDTTEGIHHLQSSIISGLDKANQILREPFGPYFMRTDQLIYEADSVLFIGYGFSDMHLNRMFPFIRTDSKERKVVVIDWAGDNEDGMSYRHDGWTYGLFKTIPFNAYEMNDGKSKEPKSVLHYKRNRILEKSSNSEFPLAIWYNGLLEACRTPQLIFDELE